MYVMDTKINDVNAINREQQFERLTNDEDVSLLRQPMRTALNGFLEAKRAYENGTDEVRRLLLHECFLLYECNVCRNIFRSLVNFISHKRNYCKRPFEGNNRSFSDYSSNIIIQSTDRPTEPWFNKSRSTGSSPIPSKVSTRDLSKIIERLKKVDVSAQPATQHHPTVQKSNDHESTEVQPHKSDATANEERHKDNSSDPILHLESVPTSSQAVYQTFKPINACDSIRTEVNEVHNLLSNRNSMIGPDGKAVMSQSFCLVDDPSKALDCEAEGTALSPLNALEEINPLGRRTHISCDICQISFQTQKTLSIHIQKKHSSSTYVFQCPTCSMTFLQPAAVIRHLANEHKKPLKRIRKMRDSILRKRIQIGNVQAKGPSRELKGLQLDSIKEMASANDKGDVATRQNSKPVSTCNYCQKTFERRAAFATHLANCPSKKLAIAKNEVQSKTRVAAKEEIHTKLRNQKNTPLVKNVKGNESNGIETKNVEQKEIKGEKDGGMGEDFHDYKSAKNPYCHVKIKQEPPEEEFNSSSTQATNGSDINALFANLENQTFGEGLQTVSLDLMVSTQSEVGQDVGEIGKKEEESSIKSDPIKAEHGGKEKVEHVGGDLSKKKAKSFRTVPASKQLTCRCKICNKQFNALSNLRRHISMFHYRARRFGCNLCDYRAFRRYDIVNHLSFVHKMQGERESMAVQFVTMHDVQYSKDDVEHDIVVVNDALEKSRIQENGNVKTYENKCRRKKLETETEKDKVEVEVENEKTSPSYEAVAPTKSEVAPNDVAETNLPTPLRKKLRKALAQEGDNCQRRPIRNRIKTVNNDFVYDLSTLKEEPKDQTIRLSLKRRNTMAVIDNKHGVSAELIPSTLPIKSSPHRLRTEPLIPANKDVLKGYAARVYRNVVQEALASPSTLPDLPTERPQMRPRLSLPSRSDNSSTPVIEATELEVARLESTFFDDSFLEKFAKKANPSFKMKPLLALQHSPLNSILQKFENNSQKHQNTDEAIMNATSLEHNGTGLSPERCATSLLEPIPNTLHTLSENILKEIDSSPPNGARIVESSTPPSTPRKRITLMQRLAENKAKRCDPLLRSALEN
ncbi:zinc finger protein 800 [Stomoxys calcitrans]|uniref:zinc finger protein 800 n=1 Tax=Stomoxys calcitrans TaxID=35570 RepID=UPI0027E26AF4|nr:zinc finger protein 800 [Stomoxys calcitrans]